MESNERRDPIAARNEGAEHRFWVNLETGEVEEGRESPAAYRMGPYATREEAERAFDTAAQRNEEWAEDDRRWNDDDWGSPSGTATPP